MAVPEVKALIFDVFGTVVDWRNSIIEQAAAFGQVRGIERDWAAFADSWPRQVSSLYEQSTHRGTALD